LRSDAPSSPSFPTRRSSDLTEFVGTRAPFGKAEGVGTDAEIVGEAVFDAAADGIACATLNDAAAGERIDGKVAERQAAARENQRDRKSTRLNSSHVKISYAV